MIGRRRKMGSVEEKARQKTIANSGQQGQPTHDNKDDCGAPTDGKSRRSSDVVL